MGWIGFNSWSLLKTLILFSSSANCFHTRTTSSLSLLIYSTAENVYHGHHGFCNALNPVTDSQHSDVMFVSNMYPGASLPLTFFAQYFSLLQNPNFPLCSSALVTMSSFSVMNCKLQTSFFSPSPGNSIESLWNVLSFLHLFPLLSFVPGHHSPQSSRGGDMKVILNGLARTGDMERNQARKKWRRTERMKGESWVEDVSNPFPL